MKPALPQVGLTLAGLLATYSFFIDFAQPTLTKGLRANYDAISLPLGGSS